jgi:hypothetical protein
MKKLNIITVLVFLISFLGCTKDEYVQPAPQLQIQVISKYLVPVQGANVTLYNTEENLYHQADPIKNLQTNEVGQVLFEDLEEQRYYFFVEKDGLNNTSDVASTKNPVQTGQRFEVVVKIANPIDL